MGSEMKFYKIDDQNFVFSVKTNVNGAIRYYHLSIDENEISNVRRIKNAFAFVEAARKLPKVIEFSSDYVKIITFLIDYCESVENLDTFSEKRKKAYDYSKLMRAAANEKLYGANNLNDGELVIAERPSKIKIMETEGNSFYDIDGEDKMFIAAGIQTNTSANRFRLM